MKCGDLVSFPVGKGRWTREKDTDVVDRGVLSKSPSDRVKRCPSVLNFFPV